MKKLLFLLLSCFLVLAACSHSEEKHSKNRKKAIQINHKKQKVIKKLKIKINQITNLKQKMLIVMSNLLQNLHQHKMNKMK